MVTSDIKRFLEVKANAVKFLVTILRIKLPSLYCVWFVLTDISEHCVVHIKCTFVDAVSFLTLIAHAQNRLEFV